MDNEPLKPTNETDSVRNPFNLRNQAWRTRGVVGLMVLSSIVTALVLRPAASTIGPVLDELTAALHLTPTEAGILTALPGLCFALVGLFANRIASRTGITGSLILATALVAAGMIFRVVTDSWSLFLILSVVALGGAAVGNVVLPAFIKAEFPKRAAPMATAYTTALAIGTSLPILFVTGISRSVNSQWPGSGWRVALGIWALIAVVALVLWLLLYIGVPQLRGRAGVPKRAGHWWTLFRSPTAVALMLFFGLQSMHAYIQFGWIPTAYQAGGLSGDAAGVMGTIISLGGIPGGLLMPSIVAGKKWVRPSIVFFGILLIIGYVGIAVAPTTLPWLWAVCLAIAGFCFPTALALIIERTREPGMTASVSGFVQPVGYLLAAIGPFLVGAAFEKVGSWPPIMYALAATSVLIVAAGWAATRPRYIDDEMNAPVR